MVSSTCGNSADIISFTIEREKQFPTNPSRLCDWCEYKEICRQWSHLCKLKNKPLNEYLNDSGVKLVNRYAELKAKQNQVKLDLYAEMEKVEEALIEFPEKENVDVVFGSDSKIRIKTTSRYSCPSKNSKQREELQMLIREYGKWDEVAQLDTNAINKIIQENKWDNEIIKTLKDYVKLEKSKRLYLGKIK